MDSEVLDRLRVSVVAAVSAAAVVDWWVEDHLSKYVVVSGIPEENWAASGWQGICRDNPAVGWGHRSPLVIGRAWQHVSVKVEVQNAAAVGEVVRSRVLVGAKRCGAQLAIAAGGKGVTRDPIPTKGGAQVGRSAAGGVKCFGCGKAGHVRRDCRASGGTSTNVRLPFRCWGCGGVGHGISLCPGRALPVTSAAGVPVPAAGSGAVIGGAKRRGGPLAGSGFRGRPFGGRSMLGYLVGGAGRVAAAPQGARA